MSPSEVNESNERGLWWYIYWPKNSLKRPRKVSTFPSSKVRFQFQEGDLVRITGLKNSFTRDINQKWSSEVFKISSRIKRNGIPVYKLTDFMDEQIRGTFYQSELEKIYK